MKCFLHCVKKFFRMTVHIKIGNNFKTKKSDVHNIPCQIYADVDTKVSQFFNTLIQNDEKTLKASFRGHLLKGQCINIPKGYIGLILHENVRPIRENDERNFYPVLNFEKFTYWNWDRNITKNDAFQQILDWIDVAEALHAPLENVE